MLSPFPSWHLCLNQQGEGKQVACTCVGVRACKRVNIKDPSAVSGLAVFTLLTVYIFNMTLTMEGKLHHTVSSQLDLFNMITGFFPHLLKKS